MSETISLKGRSLLRLDDLSDAELFYLLDLAEDFKRKKRMGIRGDALRRKNIALIFEKSSTRTRCAFTVAARDEGGGAEYLGTHDIHFGKKESIADTARVLGRMFDGIAFRGFSQNTVEMLAKHSGIPVREAQGAQGRLHRGWSEQCGQYADDRLRPGGNAFCRLCPCRTCPGRRLVPGCLGDGGPARWQRFSFNRSDGGRERRQRPVYGCLGVHG